MKDGIHKIGEAWVDSGQLMVVDPCYLHSWKYDDEFLDIRRYRDQDGKVWEYKKDFPHYEYAIKALGGLTPNQLIKSSAWTQIPDEEIPELAKAIGEFSYNGASRTTIAKGAGEIGGTGTGNAVVFRSGFGDGVYPIYALVEGGRVLGALIDMGLTTAQAALLQLAVNEEET